jgi:hypothetical protein
MGLDIYLYTAAQAAQNAAYEKASEEWWADGPDGTSPRDRATEEERQAWSAQYSYTGCDDVPSEEFPEHLFNRRYLRSSYNGAGFNRVVPDLVGSSTEKEYPNARGSLYWIFESMGREWDGDEGILGPEDIVRLRAARIRALDVADALLKSDRLRVLTISPNMFGPRPTLDDAGALAKYRTKAAERPIADDDWWSNIDMEVFGGGLTVLAALPGMATFNIPGVHLVWRMDEDGIESYVQSAKITAEFCDEAIMLIERDGSCKMSWSG